MIQRWLSHASLKVGFSAAVSTLCVNRRTGPVSETPFIGKAALRPFLLEAMTGTTFVGLISPEVRIALPALMNLPES